MKYSPELHSAVVQPGEGCPGANTIGNQWHHYLFQVHREQALLPGSVDVDAMSVRDADALTIIEAESRLIQNTMEKERHNERVSRG